MFRVEWIQTAVDELADIWTKSDSVVRKGITAAAHQIDQQLSTDPNMARRKSFATSACFITSPKRKRGCSETLAYAAG